MYRHAQRQEYKCGKQTALESLRVVVWVEGLGEPLSSLAGALVLSDPESQGQNIESGKAMHLFPPKEFEH